MYKSRRVVFALLRLGDVLGALCGAALALSWSGWESLAEEKNESERKRLVFGLFEVRQTESQSRHSQSHAKLCWA